MPTDPMTRYATGAAAPGLRCPHGQPSISQCAGCRAEHGTPGTCSMGKPNCYCGAEPYAESRGAKPIAWSCGTRVNDYGTIERPPACIINAGHDRGPQPQTCPWCGSRVIRQTWPRWDYACGSVAIRNGQFRRDVKQDISSTCILNVLAARTRLAEVKHA